MSRFRDATRRPVTWADLRDGRVDASRLAEERDGWLGYQPGPDPRDPPDDYAWLRETEETSCPDCGAGEHEQDRCAERSTT